MKYDLAIVGAGIVGAACAAECAGAGLRTLLVERGPVGAGTTAAGMGHLVVLDDSPAQLALSRYSLELWQASRAALPPSVEFDACGTLWVAADAEEMAEAERKALVYRAAGLAADVLDARQVASVEPQLRSGLAGGVRVPGDAVVYPPCAAQWLVERARAAGAEVRLGAAVVRLDDGLVLADGSRVAARRVLNAAGAGAGGLTPGLPLRLKKGHLAITERYPGFLRHQVIELGYLHSAHAADADSVAFNAQPRRSGQVLLGSSRQFDQPHAAVDQGLLGRMLARAVGYLPGLRNCLVTRVWTGQRVATPDNLPLVGPAPGQPGVWLAAGHEGLGITTSLGTARLLADLLLGRRPELDPAPYDPARLAVSRG